MDFTKTPKTAIVVGASSGIGAACVHELARRGWHVAGVARREEELVRVCTSAEGQKAIPFPHDVHDYHGIAPYFDRIVSELGGLGMIIYAAGIMPRIDPETYDSTLDREVIEVNLLGAIAWLNCAAAHFRKQGEGSIVGISSVSGDRGRRGYPAYCTSKAALNAFLESLRNRLSRFGVRVTTIKPGFIDTAMTKGMPNLFWLASPQQAAQSIVDAAEKGARQRYVFRRWAAVAFVIRNIPSFVFRRLDI